MDDVVLFPRLGREQQLHMVGLDIRLLYHNLTSCSGVIREAWSLRRNLARNKSSAVAEMGDRGHNTHGRKRGRGCCDAFADSWDNV